MIKIIIKMIIMHYPLVLMVMLKIGMKTKMTYLYHQGIKSLMMNNTIHADDDKIKITFIVILILIKIIIICIFAEILYI